MYYRQTTLHINTDAIIHNLKAVKYRSDKEVIAVIKANGYGIGAIAMANILIPNNIAMIAVSSMDEAMYLRKNGIKKEILVLGYTDSKFIKDAITNNVTLTVPSLDWVKEISSLDPINLRVHLKADTNMHRLGIRNSEDWMTALILLKKLQVKVEGAYTHYSSSDEENQIITKKQYLNFKELIDNSNHKFKWIHTCNSDAAINYKEDTISNAVRSGIALIGYAKFNEDLLPSLALYTKITNLNYLKEGDTVSYSCTYTAQENEIIATIPIGYADGFVRANQGRSVFLNKEKVEIVGRICMDQCMIKANSKTKVNDIVEIFGPNIKLTEMASELNTIVYEIITLLSNRVTRLYFSKNKKINLKNSYK